MLRRTTKYLQQLSPTAITALTSKPGSSSVTGNGALAAFTGPRLTLENFRPFLLCHPSRLPYLSPSALEDEKAKYAQCGIRWPLVSPPQLNSTLAKPQVKAFPSYEEQSYLPYESITEKRYLRLTRINNSLKLMDAKMAKYKQDQFYYRETYKIMMRKLEQQRIAALLLKGAKVELKKKSGKLGKAQETKKAKAKDDKTKQKKDKVSGK